MTKYDDKAIDPGEVETRFAAVRIREDIVLVVSHLSSINKQLIWVRWLLAIIAAVLILRVLMEFFYN